MDNQSLTINEIESLLNLNGLSARRTAILHCILHEISQIQTEFKSNSHELVQIANSNSCTFKALTGAERAYYQNLLKAPILFNKS